jgi:endonuclease/exonuclease/phosphatase family metal-dependent hydrolase
MFIACGSAYPHLTRRYCLTSSHVGPYECRAWVSVAVSEEPVYATHLYRSRGDNALRLYQGRQLLAWIKSRGDVGARVVCGDFNAALKMPYEGAGGAQGAAGHP